MEAGRETGVLLLLPGSSDLVWTFLDVRFYPIAFFTKIEKAILKLYGTTKDPDSKSILRKKNLAGIILTSDYTTKLQ